MKRHTTLKIIVTIMAIACWCWALTDCVMADTLVVSRDSKEVTLEGELLVTAADNSILFATPDGQLHIFTADKIVSMKPTSETLPTMDHDELGKSLLADLPKGFKIHKTEKYVIAYQTGFEYAEWIGDLYEDRLVSEFEKFAKKSLKYELIESEFPLAVVVFDSRPAYDRYVIRELQTEPGTMIAHYSQMTNRVAMFDLTFEVKAPGEKRKLREVLAKPDAIPMVTTIIHEGTHQLMFNRGMQTRLGDVPLWLNEGMANWFETPDPRNGKGWRRPGMVNHARMRQLRKYFAARPGNSIETLISTNDRFEGEAAFDAYAESWALMHFLLKRRTKDFRKYLKVVANKRPGFPVDAETRLKEFTDQFGDLEKLDKAFLKYVRTLK